LLLKKDRRFEVKKSRYTDGQILAILKQAKAGTPIQKLGQVA